MFPFAASCTFRKLFTHLTCSVVFLVTESCSKCKKKNNVFDFPSATMYLTVAALAASRTGTVTQKSTLSAAPVLFSFIDRKL